MTRWVVVFCLAVFGGGRGSPPAPRILAASRVRCYRLPVAERRIPIPLKGTRQILVVTDAGEAIAP